MGLLLEAILQGLWESYSDKNPEKSDKIREKVYKAYDKQCDTNNRIYDEYEITEERARSLSDDELKSAYNNAPNNIKKSAYAQEIKNRVAERQPKEPKYKPIDGYKS